MKQKIREYIEANKEELFKTIQELVQIETVVGNEMAGQAYMKKKYEELGLEIHEFEPVYDELKDHEAFVDSKIPFAGRKNLIGIHRGTGEGKSITLHGHIDVVSAEPESNWTVDPWGGEIRDGKLYGRGAADMKSGLIANWFALKTVLDLGYELKGDVHLHSVLEEEAGGGGGTLAVMEKGFLTDGLISTEPHNLKLTVAHAGIMYFRVKVRGRTAHAGLAHEGINAIEKMYKVFNALDQLNKERAKTLRFPLFEAGSGQAAHLNLGVLQAGDWASTVPGEAILEGRVGFIPGETRAQIRQLIETTIHEAIKGDEWLEKHPPQIEWYGWSTEPWHQDENHPFVTRFKQVAEDVMQREVPIIGRASGNDARFTQYYNRAGICFGPIGENMHGPDENVDLESVAEVANVFANYIIEWTES